MLTPDCRLPYTSNSRCIFVAIVFLSIFGFFGFSPLSATEGWAKEVTLEWDPNTEPDLGGYIVHYGTESGIYDHSLDVGNNTSVVISGLDPDADYYFAVSAYNLDGLTSDMSNEVSTALSPSPAYQASSGGGGGGCFIDTTAKAPFQLWGRGTVNTLRSWWRNAWRAIEKI